MSVVARTDRALVTVGLGLVNKLIAPVVARTSLTRLTPGAGEASARVIAPVVASTEVDLVTVGYIGSTLEREIVWSSGADPLCSGKTESKISTPFDHQGFFVQHARQPNPQDKGIHHYLHAAD